MRVAASYLFCMIVIAALSVVPAESEEPDSSWKKFCLNDVCHVGKGRLSDCGLIGELTLVKRKAEPGKRLSIALPASINPERTIRITIDGNAPVSGKISRCDCACWVDYYEAGAELVEQLKQGQRLVLEAVSRNKPHIVAIPLAGFAAAYDGPPTPMPEMKVRTASLAGKNTARGSRLPKNDPAASAMVRGR
jgi:invasion protein IalB